MKSYLLPPRRAAHCAAISLRSLASCSRYTLLAVAWIVGFLLLQAGCTSSGPQLRGTSSGATDARTVLSMSTWIIDRILGELDYSTLEQSFERIDRDLEVVQRMVSSLNDELGTRVKSVREQLAQKVDRQDVPRLVTEELQKLRSEFDAFESRLGAFKMDVAALEEKFGYLPTELATPVVYTEPSEGQPEVHPLTKQWAELLSRSEQNRLDLVDKRRYYEDQAPEVQALTQTQEQLIRETSELHERAMGAIREKLQSRQEMRRSGKRTTHPAIRDFDREIASLAWVVAVTFPQQSGPERGRLGVPKQLVSPQASEVVHALKLSGASATAIRSLYRRLIDDLPVDGYWAAPSIDEPAEGAAPAAPPADGKPAYEVPRAVSIRFVLSRPELERLEKATLAEQSVSAKVSPMVRDWRTTPGQQAERLYREGSATLSDAWQVEWWLRKLLVHSSHVNEIVRNGEKQKQTILDALPGINEEANRQLNESLDVYIDRLVKIRPNHPEMAMFARGVLRPLAQLVRDTECVDWKSPTEQEKTWDRFLNSSAHPDGWIISGYRPVEPEELPVGTPNGDLYKGDLYNNDLHIAVPAEIPRDWVAKPSK